MITLRSIPHSDQRYPTVGDWVFNDFNDLSVRVSAMADWRYEVLVELHEMVEALLCYHRGISEQSICEFDKAFEANRKEGNTDEPGWAPDAPYRKEHAFAERLERLMAEELGVDWQHYEDAVNSLP